MLWHVQDCDFWVIFIKSLFSLIYNPDEVGPILSALANIVTSIIRPQTVSVLAFALRFIYFMKYELQTFIRLYQWNVYLNGCNLHHQFSVSWTGHVAIYQLEITRTKISLMISNFKRKKKKSEFKLSVWTKFNKCYFLMRRHLKLIYSSYIHALTA